MKKEIKIFCFGFGQVAKSFIKKLLQKKINFRLSTTNTKKTEFKKIGNKKYISYYFFDDKFDSDLLDDLSTSNKILISIPPRDGKDLVLKSFFKNFKKNNFDWITYLSATSVYGNKNGKWVNENSSLNPSSKRGLSRLKAEKDWLNFQKKFNLPIQIFRLAGIYSLENNILKRLNSGSLTVVKKSKHYFSRIFVDDIAEILILSLKKFNPGEIYNICDNYPCSNEEIAKYASNLINIDLPKKINFKDLKNKILKDFYKDSKKISNRKMKSFFRYKLKYPTYKEGLNMIKNHMV